MSADRRHRVDIRAREDGLLQVLCYRWYEPGPEDEYCHGEAWWAEEHGPAILTDSIEQARQLAREELARSAGACG
ncbi:MAG TPA: hypothetical protein VM925_27980 [Labilithrix sp.]|nr:hypothetical protein [Labilithrix sp.]